MTKANNKITKTIFLMKIESIKIKSNSKIWIKTIIVEKKKTKIPLPSCYSKSIQ